MSDREPIDLLSLTHRELRQYAVCGTVAWHFLADVRGTVTFRGMPAHLAFLTVTECGKEYTIFPEQPRRDTSKLRICKKCLSARSNRTTAS